MFGFGGGDDKQQPAAGGQHQGQREKADHRPSGGHHQRYESADNKQKYQAIINEKMRKKNEVAEQFSMTDAANYEQVLKMMHASGQAAQAKAGAANDGSNRKGGRRAQEPHVQASKEKSGSGREEKPAAHRGSASGGGASADYSGMSQAEQ